MEMQHGGTVAKVVALAVLLGGHPGGGAPESRAVAKVRSGQQLVSGLCSGTLVVVPGAPPYRARDRPPGSAAASGLGNLGLVRDHPLAQSTPPGGKGGPGAEGPGPGSFRSAEGGPDGNSVVHVIKGVPCHNPGFQAGKARQRRDRGDGTGYRLAPVPFRLDRHAGRRGGNSLGLAECSGHRFRRRPDGFRDGPAPAEDIRETPPGGGRAVGKRNTIDGQIDGFRDRLHALRTRKHGENAAGPGGPTPPEGFGGAWKGAAGRRGPD